MKPHVTLAPTVGAFDGVSALLSGLVDTMVATERGVVEDTDAASLHDFRVALRGMRTLLSEIGDVLPAASVGRARKELRWLGEATGGQRDLDVHIENFAAYRALLPAAMADAPDALETHIRTRRRQAHAVLVSALRSARYVALIDETRSLAATPGPGAGNPLRALADKRIWKRYRVILKNGRRIDADSDPEALHALRKDCKKLRYGLEFFKDLYPAEETASALRTVRRLQNCLGAFQDLEVHADALSRYSAEMTDAGNASARTLKATDLLVAALGREQARERARFQGRFGAFEEPGNHALFRALFKPAARETVGSD